jgi:hypothetical protein
MVELANTQGLDRIEMDRNDDVASSPATRTPERLRGRAHKLALTAHILGGVGWFGGAVLVAFCVLGAASTNDPTLARALYRTVQTAPWLSVPLGLVALATGAVLGVGTRWGLIRHWWVVAKIVIAIVVIVTDPLLIARGAHEALITGHPPNWLFGPTIAHVVLLAVATALSVFKPRGRTPWGRPRGRAETKSARAPTVAAGDRVTPQSEAPPLTSETASV